MASTRLELSDTVRKDGTSDIKIRVYHDGTSRRFSIGIKVTPEDWTTITTGTPRGNLAKIRKRVREFEARAADLCNFLMPFTFEQFKRELFKEGSVESVYAWFDRKMDTIDSHNTKEIYSNAKKSFKKFSPRLVFAQIDHEWLTDYVKWMRDKNHSDAYIGINLRCLRHLFNISDAAHYPFKGFTIPKSRNFKRALNKDQIKKVLEFSPDTGNVRSDRAQRRAVDFWIFSYLCDGINLTDILRIKWSDLSGNKLTTYRRKTKANERVITLHPRCLEIIKYYGRFRRYVFVDTYDAPLVNGWTKALNKQLKRVGDTLEFDFELTMYTARHSFASQLKRSGAPVALISELLDHNSIRTTEMYLSSFQEDVKNQWRSKLTDF